MNTVARPRWAVVAGGVAAFATMGGGIAIGLSYVVEVPVIVGAAALAVFLIGCILAGVVVHADAKARGASFLSALGQAIRDAIRWMFYFLP